MGLLDWLSKPTSKEEGKGLDALTLPPEEKGAEVGGLNFKSAVDAHMKWKIRLESYINGSSNEDLKVDVVCRDDHCPLGKWIYSRGGGEFGYSETFFDMKAHHANFHRCAGEVLAAAQAGRKDLALRLLHQGEYVRASERVKKLLAKLFVLVADGKTAIDAHVKWKERLHDYITGASNESLSVADVMNDDQCTLGRWLHAEGREHYGHLPAFQRVEHIHHHFHECAAQVLEAAQAGNAAKAMELLEEGEYAVASDEVTAALVELFEQVRKTP